MQFTGSLEVRGFKTLGKKRTAITRAVRDAEYRVFSYAIGAMLLEIGQQIPYLTGATRGAIQEMLQQVDARILQYGGRRAYTNKLQMSTTLRKMGKHLHPRHSSNLYAVKYTRTYINGQRIRSRGDWRDYLVQHGQSEDSEKGQNPQPFAVIGTTVEGRISFHFRLATEHWTRYDLNSVPGTPKRGPWNVLMDGLAVYDKAKNEMQHQFIARVKRVFEQDPDNALKRLQSWMPRAEEVF
jgi:hypothetical protein